MPRVGFAVAFIALIAIVLAAPASAFADTYQVFDLGADDHLFYGMSDSGLVVLHYIGAPDIYTSYLNGIEVGSSSTAPVFTADDGTFCIPTLPSGWTAHYGVCNNARVAFTGTFGSSPTDFVYFSNNPTYTGGGQLGGAGLYMNAVGDVLVDDGYQDEWYLYVDRSPTPEPANILLLATGILPLAVIFRKRCADRLA